MLEASLLARGLTNHRRKGLVSELLTRLLDKRILYAKYVFYVEATECTLHGRCCLVILEIKESYTGRSFLL